jgi:Uma2 family endonuclease
LKKRFTYADFLKWDDSVRVELIDGEVYDMTPAPSRRYQEFLMKLVLELGNFLKGEETQGVYSPFDVRLPGKETADADIITVL